MGNSNFATFNSLLHTEPPPQYGDLIHQYLSISGCSPLLIPSSSWANRAISDYVAFIHKTRTIPHSDQGLCKYKLVHRHHCPVPTYMPNPRAQQFLNIPELPPLASSTCPLHYSLLPTDDCMTPEQLLGLLKTIESGLLTKEETNLLAFVVHARSHAFTWTYKEKGFFDPAYFPDHKIPYVEHVPWQVNPSPLPLSIQPAVCDEVRCFELLGHFAPSTASYRSALWAIAKKPGSKPPVQLVIAVEKLNAVTVRDTSLPPNINDFAESFTGHVIYSAGDMFSGFDTRILNVESCPLETFHLPDGPKQQTMLIQGYTNSIQEFLQCTDHVLK